MSEKQEGPAIAVPDGDGGWIVKANGCAFARYKNRGAANAKRNDINRWFASKSRCIRNNVVEAIAMQFEQAGHQELWTPDIVEEIRKFKEKT